jgi:hypothetical protein
MNASLLALMTVIAPSFPPPPPGAPCETVVAAALADGASGAPRPAWAASGVPDRTWRLADAGSVERDGDRRTCLLEAALADAEASAEAAPDDVDRRFALAVVVGLMADREGGRTKVRAASRLHVELRAILDMDPDHARARHLLGRLHAGVMRMDRVTRWIATNLLGGGALKEASWAGAEQNLVFAEQAVPGVLDHHYELARLYEDTHRPDLAAEELRHVLALPVTSAMEDDVRAKAGKLLESLGG